MNASSGFRFTSPLHSPLDPLVAPIADGTAVLRPLRPGETEPQQAVFDAMSPESRFSRYLSGMHELTPSMWRMLGAVDGTNHVAWLASVDGEAAGVARYIMVGSCAAELAFEVADRHHGRGLGAVLLDTVTTVAAAFRVRRLQATVLPSNAPSRHLLSLVGLTAGLSDGLLEANGPFHLMARPRVERPAVVSLAYAVRDSVGPDLARHRAA